MLNDLYEIVYDGVWLGQKILNVFHVERTTPVETAGSISDAFQNSILPILRLAQEDTYTSNELRIKNLGDPTDFGVFSLSAALGLRPGEGTPPFVSAEIRFARRRNDMRNGYKRFAGWLESDMFEGVFAAAALVLLDNIGDAMIADWLSSVDSHVVCNYIIIKRVCETTDPATGKCLQYRLPKDPEVPVFYKPIEHLDFVSARSQVSRRVAAS